MKMIVFANLNRRWNNTITFCHLNKFFSLFTTDSFINLMGHTFHMLNVTILKGLLNLDASLICLN